MFEVITLASGSEGNATLVRNESAAFLVDAGLSARQLEARLLAMGEKAKAIEVWKKGLQCPPVSRRDKDRKIAVEKKLKEHEGK